MTFQLLKSAFRSGRNTLREKNKRSSPDTNPRTNKKQKRNHRRRNSSRTKKQAVVETCNSLMFVGSEVWNQPLRSLESLDLSLVSDCTTVATVGASECSCCAHSEKIAVAEEYFRQLNDHNIQGAEQLLTDDYIVYFRSSDYELAWEDLAQEGQKILDAFPDYRFTYCRIETEMVGDEVVVVVHNVTSGGTHTAKAYGFGPYDPIEPQGAFVLNDPEETRFYFRGNKIYKAEVTSKGQLNGPAGIYTQLGGFPLM